MAQGQLFDPSKVNLQQFAPVQALADSARAHGADPEAVANVTAKGPIGHAVYRAHAQAVDEANARGGEMTPSMRASYEAMTAAVGQQYSHLTAPKEEGGLGISVEVTEHDPYNSVQDAAEDVRNNSRLKVFSTATTGGHGYWSDEQNDQFRAVHDAYGHLATGRNFTRHGEEAAFQAHRAMMPPEAHAALASETRGQNSYLNWGGNDFPDNVPVELPAWAASRTGAMPAPDRSTDSRRRPVQGTLF